MIAPVVIEGYRCAPISPVLSPIAGEEKQAPSPSLSASPRLRHKLSLRRRLWGIVLPPWPKD